MSSGPDSRGGNGRNGDGTWPGTDGRGCPACGAMLGGGHGGGCPNSGYVYDEMSIIGRTESWEGIEALDAAIARLRKIAGPGSSPESAPEPGSSR